MSEEDKKEQQEKKTNEDEQNKTEIEDTKKEEEEGEHTKENSTETKKEDEEADKTKEELEKAKTENEELRQKLSSQSQVATGQKIVTEDQAIEFFNNMTDIQFEEEHANKFNGKTREQLISDLKVIKLSNQHEKFQARLVLNDTLDDEISKNSRLTKLKGDMKEFFDKFISNKDKTDTNKIKQHLKDAEIYARGKYNMQNPNQPKNKVNTENINPNREIGKHKKTETENEGEEEYLSQDGKNKIKVKKNVYGNTTEYTVDTMDEEPKFN